ncbi:MAG: hypothetical protein NZ521_10985 [Flammeovirgaceae bacterium]|nr:hypothetical protein [Flammeovirgaceae bacterium]MDW8288728.1 hypothetical protein [Flammeovirgaceae bacterium]
MKKLLTFALLTTFVWGIVSFGQLHSQKTQITIFNDTDFAIDHFYVSPVNKNQWGPDQLGDHPEDYIGIGESFTLKGIPCGTYDLKIVAQDGLTCIIEDAVLCADGSYEWHLTDEHVCGQ